MGCTKILTAQEMYSRGYLVIPSKKVQWAAFIYVLWLRCNTNIRSFYDDFPWAFTWFGNAEIFWDFSFSFYRKVYYSDCTLIGTVRVCTLMVTTPFRINDICKYDWRFQSERAHLNALRLNVRTSDRKCKASTKKTNSKNAEIIELNN